jgi:hypothetical protein
VPEEVERVRGERERRLDESEAERRREGESGAAVAERDPVVLDAREVTERDARRLGPEDPVEGRAEDEEDVVRREDGEGPFEASGREGLRRAQDARRVGDEAPHEGAQLLGPRREDHFPPGADEDRVAEPHADPREGVARGGGREAEALRGARDVLLLEKRVEREEEVQVTYFHGTKHDRCRIP